MVKAEGHSRWAAFIDVDEYLFRADHGCMMGLLERMEGDRGALAVAWRVFAHSNTIVPPPADRLLMETNRHTAPFPAEQAVEKGAYDPETVKASGSLWYRAMRGRS